MHSSIGPFQSMEHRCIENQYTNIPAEVILTQSSIDALKTSTPNKFYC